MAVPAPGRFSTTTGRPSVSLIPSATVRASRSAGPPAAYGLTKVMVVSGNDCAAACPAKPDMAARIVMARRYIHPSRSAHGAFGPSRAIIVPYDGQSPRPESHLHAQHQRI